MKQFRRSAFLCACAVLLGAGMHLSPAAAERGGAETEQVPADTPLCISPAIRVLAAQTTMKKNGVLGEELCFAQEDFSAVLGYAPTEITLETLPDPMAGVLKLGGMTLAAGSRLSVSVLPGLRFVPTGGGTAQVGSASDAVPSVSDTLQSVSAGETDEAPVSASFTFTASGSAYETAVPLSCELYLLTAPNAAPTASERHVTTYSGVAVSASLTAADPELDGLTYEIVRQPKKGSVTVGAEDGSFVYTPADGARGRDVFSWCVTDVWGNRSEVVRTSLEIRRADDSLYYADLAGHPCAAAAMRLTEDGIFGGTTLGEHSFFAPDTAVTRGEFLVCAMRAAGYDGGGMAELSMFANAEEIPDWLSGYLAAAYRDGIVHGSTDAAGNTVFEYDGVITRAEAAVLTYRLFDIDTPAVMPVFSSDAEDALPAWSVGAFASVCAAGIMPADGPGEVLDRAMCAVLLSAAMDGRK